MFFKEMDLLVGYLNDESAPVPPENEDALFNTIVRIAPHVFHGYAWRRYNYEISGEGVILNLGNARIYIDVYIEGCDSSGVEIDPRDHTDESLIALINRLLF